MSKTKKQDPRKRLRRAEERWYHRLPEKAPDWLYNVTAPVDWAVRAICLFKGHQPCTDNCGIPSHDYCAWCHRPTPRLCIHGGAHWQWIWCSEQENPGGSQRGGAIIFRGNKNDPSYHDLDACPGTHRTVHLELTDRIPSSVQEAIDKVW